MTLNEFGKDEILRTLAWQPIAVAAVSDISSLFVCLSEPATQLFFALLILGCYLGCLASFVIKIVFDYIPLRCDIDAPSMPPLLSLPLSMACDDSDGNRAKAAASDADASKVIIYFKTISVNGGFFDNMAVNWELTFPTKHEKFWSWERNLRAWLEKTVEMQNQCAHPTAATTNSTNRDGSKLLQVRLMT
ncbi:hypothetical protein Tco_0664878 [Tanacetum coccineum]